MREILLSQPSRNIVCCILYIEERIEKEGEEDVEEVIEKFTSQMKKSGWSMREKRDMVLSGCTGWKRGLARRKEESGEAYRSAVIFVPYTPHPSWTMENLREDSRKLRMKWRSRLESKSR